MTRTIDEALDRFELVAGPGSEESEEACAMTLLAWVAGREWTDAPPCAHLIIRNAVVRVNDAGGTSPEMREQIVRAGERGILDTWWIPIQVIALAFALESDGEEITEHARILRALDRIAKWKDDKGLPPALTGANLRDASLTDANLRGADLRGANLRDANLRGASLRGANLRDASLRGASLRGAYLTGANLKDASLTDANLTDANLTDANLRGADLRGANLRDANLTGADLRGAHGVPLGGMPDGWTLNDVGLWVRV